jgi:peptide/nickel transport system ATP-binding protein
VTSTRELSGSGRSSADRLVVSDLEIGLRHQNVDVVKEVSFSITAGELLGLVGESGSGKTTVALALLGHVRRGLEIKQGEVLLDGLSVLSLKGEPLRAVRGAKVAYIPQDPGAALNPTLRVGTQLREVLGEHPGAVADAEARLDEVVIEARLDADPDILRRYPHQLSGGQQQRVAIAMAFACRPSVIVLDEPTTGLDVSVQRHILETVRRMCSSYGVAAVYVSHDLAVVSGLVSQVAVMYAGRIVELGPTSAVFGRPTHPYTRGLLGAVPSPERAEVLLGIEGQPPRPGRRPRGCSFAPRCAYSTDQCRLEPPAPTRLESTIVRCYRAREIKLAQNERVPANPPVPNPESTVLSARGISAWYGNKQVLTDVGLDLASGACIAIVGESGSGKTTLARCIVGLHENWSGEIRFQGSPVARGSRRRPRELLRQVQYVFQNPYTSLNPRKTIGQTLTQTIARLLSIPVAEREGRVLRALEDVSLNADFLDRYPDQLSGGERQRVALARALVAQPELLVCDEVTSALDVSVQAAIVGLLRRQQMERQLGMIFITHNLALARSIAQSAVVLHQGRIVECGPTNEVLDHPKEAYTIGLLQDIPKLTAHGEVAADILEA